MHVGMALSFVTFLDVILGVLLHHRAVITCSEGLPCLGATSEVLVVNSSVELLQDFESLGRVDALG